MIRFFLAFVMTLLMVGVDAVRGDEQPSAADLDFFESKIRPLLIAKCQECHGANKPKSGLRLDSRDAILTGGESGPAAVAGKPDTSLLIDVIGYRGAIQMPPKAKLADAEIAALTEWVRRGLPWPDSKVVATTPATGAPLPELTVEQKAFWSFQPVKRPLPPPLAESQWIRSPIDSFILAELEARGLHPAPELDKRRLLRRVTVDLVGLLPTPEELSDFLADDSADALERVVDRLLASPRYGERWARHWLDVARYADSNGLDENLAYANAFRYRDYVVRAFCEDKPYDTFLIEQIAGDLLDNSNDIPANASSFDPLVATGFLCLGAKMLAEDDPVKMQMDIIDEQVDTIGRAVMGLTMGCARCHDHKFDPLTMEDYYGLAGIFKSTQTMDTFTVVARWHERPLATATEIQRRDERQQLATAQKQAIDKLKADATEAILSEARRHPGAYLLAATRELLLAEQLKSAKPRGNDPNPQGIAGAILIEAEDYPRGNVLKDRDTYGKGIGVLVNRGETPNFTEYDVDVEASATYQLELRYAAAGSRPVKVFINGKLMKSDAASQVTGSWTPETQTWFVEGIVTLSAGHNVIRLEQPQFFPHIDKLLLTPATHKIAEQVVEIPAANPHLVPSLVPQWTKAFQVSKDDSKSILTAWRQFMTSRQLTPDPSENSNGIARLLSESQPASFDQLAARYDQLFADAQHAWTELKSTEAGREVKSLSDPTLESARTLLIDPKGPFAAPADIEVSFSPEIASQLKDGREELSRREAAIPKFAEAMAVADSRPENLKIHLRGSHLTLGREVPHVLPRVLVANGSRNLPEGSGRLQFARWLASSDHPLTSRVMANRVWQWHFGQGLVRSPDNFGRLGERPSHPELLDWLAKELAGSAGCGVRNAEFEKAELGSRNTVLPDAKATDGNSSIPHSAFHTPHSWQLKSLHRRMVGTSVYRQGGNYDASAALIDPENRLLWRFHRQRMDVEVLRDSLLAVSGQLDETPGGTMLPTANRNYVTSTANVNPAVYNSNRRAIYLPVIRSALYDVFTAFDFADPSTLAGQRDQTTVAPQALFMMNSAFVLEQSRVLARRLLDRPDFDFAARIRSLYNTAYSREASAAEISRAGLYSERVREALRNAAVAEPEIELRVWTSLCRAVVSANEFVYIE